MEDALPNLVRSVTYSDEGGALRAHRDVCLPVSERAMDLLMNFELGIARVPAAAD